jgi:N-acetylglucosamine-6-sulfatase
MYKLTMILLGTLAAIQLLAASSAPRPNLVYIVVDDLDNQTFQVALTSGLLPNTKRYIVDQGTSFSHFYVTDARGCPARESFLTGLYFHNLQGFGSGQTSCGISLFQDTSTLPVWLHAAGYRTSLIGKYSDGYGYTDANKDGKIDMSDTTYIPPGWDNWQALEYAQPMYRPGGPPPIGMAALGIDNPNQYDWFINNRGIMQYHGQSPADYQTDVLHGMVNTYLNTLAGTDSPFFLMIAPGAPHVQTYSDPTRYDQYQDAWTWDCPPSPLYTGPAQFVVNNSGNFDEADVSDKPAWLRSIPLLSQTDASNMNHQRSDRIASLQAVDQIIGDTAAKLDAQGKLQQTVFVFLSDNGWQYGNHRLTGKLDAFEESIGTPLLVSVGGGVTSSAFITSNDLTPTLMELAGVAMPYAGDGQSLVPLLSYPSLPWRARFLVEHWTAMKPGSLFDMPNYAAVRTSPVASKTPDQLYVSWETGEVEFYDYPSDPKAMTSRHTTTDPRRKQQMTLHQSSILALQTCGNGTCQSIEFRP